ncbi:MAG TPA: serine hydrolase [Candidatus Limnocylindria bacterium]|nr:serine hydrolase [Candidatus Limnocylindria bacterium]
MSADPFAPLRERALRSDGVLGALACSEDGTVLYEERADETFPAASVIKIPLVMALYADAAAGRVSLDERVAVGERAYGSGILGRLGDVGPLSLRDLAMLTIAVSDNTATNMLIDRVGADRVNERMREWGCERSVLGRKMFEKRQGRENLLTPRETASLLLRLARGECADRATSDAVIALLRECQDETRLERYLPAGTDVAHKSGWIEGVRNDAGIVRVTRTVVAAGFVRELRAPEQAAPLLGLLGWCAYRAAGGDGSPLPFELSGLT